ncbi:MAG: hypothetical protein Kow0099_14050 [Candidatus Abyssubacteria bacterium]
MLRAGELARRAGVSAATIKHYVNEGLLPRPLKTGKTMAYYDESCVERIRLIKKLQRERFLPLDVIRRLLDSGSALEEELELGRAIFKTERVSGEGRPVSEARVERHTGYPLEKIRLLEREGLVSPAVGEGGRYYDSIDCRIIEMMKRREEMGVPFDHSVETVRAYRDAMERAVREDIRLFAKNMLGDFSTRQTVKFLTEADESLDRFVVLIRHKLLRSLSREAIAQTARLSERLALVSFLPVSGSMLPPDPPSEPDERLVYFFLRGRYDLALELLESEYADAELYPAAVMAAQVLRGDTGAALRTAERRVARSARRSLENAAAGLAYMFAAGAASGFSSPMYYLKKALGHLRRAGPVRRADDIWSLFSLYVCGAVYTMLPVVFDLREEGIEALERAVAELDGDGWKRREWPDWLRGTLESDVAVAVEIRARRFLAEAYMESGRLKEASEHLARVIEIAEPEDEHSRWARVKKIEVKG